jgi:hypothetical protein
VVDEVPEMRRGEIARALHRTSQRVFRQAPDITLVRLPRAVGTPLLEREKVVEALDEEGPHHLVRQCGGAHAAFFCR